MQQSDYTAFSELWTTYRALSNATAQQPEIDFLFGLLGKYTFEAVKVGVYALATKFKYQAMPADLLEFINREGMTKEEFETKALLAYRDITNHYDYSCDMCFSDKRTALAFHAVLGSIESYGKTANEDDEKLANKFVKFYCNCDVVSYDYLYKQVRVKFSPKSYNHRRVVFIGDRDICTCICNAVYGLNNYLEMIPQKAIEQQIELKKQQLTPEEYKQAFDEALAVLGETNNGVI